MRLVAFSDIHGADLRLLENKVLRFLHPGDQIVCLGDFDEPDTIRQIIKLKQQYSRRGIQVYIEPGNHEWALYKEKPVINFDGTLTKYNEIETRFLIQRGKLIQSSRVWRFLDDLVRSQGEARIFLDESKFDEKYNLIAVHGALNGTLDKDVDKNLDSPKLWYRLVGLDDHQKNFEKMIAEGLNIMLRGHDSAPELGCQDSQGIFFIRGLGTYSLRPDARYTITVGPYKTGHYVLIDTDIPGKSVPIVNLSKIT